MRGLEYILIVFELVIISILLTSGVFGAEEIDPYVNTTMEVLNSAPALIKQINKLLLNLE